MENLKMKSYDVIGSNTQKIAQLFPHCVTERLGKDGKPELAIDFEKLQAELSNEIIGEGEERYQFTWPDKRAAVRLANTPTTMTLRPCREESVDFENTQNLYIEGDNLDVLKVLRETYLGKVKMIYIDPPYNTGNDFVYRDDFAMDKDGYDHAAGDVDEMGNRFRKNADTNARFHSDWCSMIYERLLVSRSLLSEDGVIFISIDDNEAHNLKKITEEVFGANNFLAQVVWERAFSPVNLKKHFSESHDYILCFAKNINKCICNGLPRNSESDSRYSNPDNDPRGVWTSGDLSVGPVVHEKVYEIITPSGRSVYPPNGYCWRLDKNTFNEYVADNRIWFGERGDNVPRIKRFLSEVKQGITPMTIWKYTEVGSSQDASRFLKRLFDDKAYFDYPKPIDLIKRCINLYADKSSIVLDFFSGSSTTAHAIMQQNAEDGGTRKFIMIQLPEITEERSSANRDGYANICDVAKERIRRAGKKIKEEVGLEAQNLDTGFRVFKCEDSFMNNVYFSPNDLSQADLFSQVSNIKDGTSDLSLLFGCMLDWGVQLSLPLSNFKVSDKTIYNVNDGDLVACFAEDVNEEVITAIAELMPLRVVFRDSCFSDAPLKMNLFELFKQKCGWSEEVVKNRVHVI